MKEAERRSQHIQRWRHSTHLSQDVDRLKSRAQ